MSHRLRYFLFSLFAFAAVALFARWQTAGFRWHKIDGELAYDTRWELQLSEEEEGKIIELLKQPFSYLGKGSQCYAFASADGNYVIKFPRLHRMRSPLWMRLGARIPGFTAMQRLDRDYSKKREAELERNFLSYMIAYQQLKEATALVYLHLNRTPEWKFTTTFYDKIDCAHQLDLGKSYFLLQRRASWLVPELERMMKEGDEKRAKQLVDGLLARLLERAKLGLFDKDPHITNNFGLIDGEVVQIDIGRYQDDPERARPKVYCEDIRHVLRKFLPWLSKRFPTLERHLLDKLDQMRENDLLSSGVDSCTP